MEQAFSNSNLGNSEAQLIYLSYTRHTDRIITECRHDDEDSITTIYSVKGDRNWLILENIKHYNNQLLFIHKDLILQITDALKTHVGGFSYGHFDSPGLGFVKVEINIDDNVLEDSLGYPMETGRENEEEPEDEGLDEELDNIVRIFKFTTEVGTEIYLGINQFNELTKATELDTPIRYQKIGTPNYKSPDLLEYVGDIEDYTNISILLVEGVTYVVFKVEPESNYKLNIEIELLLELIKLPDLIDTQFAPVNNFQDIYVKFDYEGRLILQSIYSDGIYNIEEPDYGYITLDKYLLERIPEKIKEAKINRKPR